MSKFFIQLKRLIHHVCIALIGLSLASVVLVLILMVWVTRWFPGNAELPHECAIVFGAAVRRGDQPGPGITRRVATATRLYQQNMVDRLYLTGGKGDVYQRSEAEVMREVALQLGVEPEDIYLEESSTSTWENLRHTRPFVVHCNSIVAVSDRYHLARIQYFAERLGYKDFYTYPVDRLPPSEFELRSTLREALAMIYSFFALRYD